MISNIISFLSDALWTLLFLAVGLFMLFSPIEMVQKTFPKVQSKTGLKLLGIFFIIIGVACMVLIGMGLL